VFDNDYRPDESMVQEEDPPVWKRVNNADAAWQSVVDTDSGEHVFKTRSFTFTGAAKLQEIEFKTERNEYLPNYGYNSRTAVAQTMIKLERDICTDLKLALTYEPGDEDSTVALMLSSFEHHFKGEVHADGKVWLYHKLTDAVKWDKWGQLAKADGVAVGKACEVALTHVDYRVTLWVDGKAVLASTDEQYDANHDELVNRMELTGSEDVVANKAVPTPEVRIGASGGPCTLNHVRVMRDVYYTAMTLRENVEGFAGPMGDYARAHNPPVTGGQIGWGVMGQPITLKGNKDNCDDLDEFFVLGDNSPQSLDSRAWITAAPSLRLYGDAAETQFQYRLGTVPRYNMIGKAFFVYWPAGFTIPGLPNLPIIPNVGRMRLIE